MKRNSRLWFRTYGAMVLESVPYTKLGLAARGLFFDLRALASRQGDGDLLALSPADIAHSLRLGESEVILALEELHKGGLIRRRQDAVEVVGFMAEQEPTTSKDRVQKHRTKVSRMAEWREKKEGV